MKGVLLLKALTGSPVLTQLSLIAADKVDATPPLVFIDEKNKLCA